MARTIDDFMNRFGSDKTLDDQEAAQYHDRFISRKDDDRDFDNGTYHQSTTEYLGKLPEQDFRQGARAAISQAPPEERQGLLGGLLGALGGGSGGGGLSRIAEMIGLRSTDPAQMDEEDGAKVLDYARRENPAAMRQVAEEKPWFVKAMGNPVVVGALTLAAAKLLKNQRNR